MPVTVISLKKLIEIALPLATINVAGGKGPEKRIFNFLG